MRVRRVALWLSRVSLPATFVAVYSMMATPNLIAAAVLGLLTGSMDKVRGASIDLSKTYTNEFVR